MKKSCFAYNRGYTLVELMVVLAILSLIMMAFYSLYITHQRTAYTQDEVVEVQQNLRIGMDSMTRDIRMAGFLIPYGIVTPGTPVITVNDNTGMVQADTNKSDSITIATASASGAVARITQQNGATFNVDDPLSVDPFSVGDIVTIIRPGNRVQPAGGGSSFSINTTNRAVPSITLNSTPGGVILPGDVIVKLGNGAIYPNTITYCLGPSSLPLPNGCGNSVTTCPSGQRCLMRIINIGQGVNEEDQLIAQNMAGLQFSYLLDDGSETSAPAQLGIIRSVRVTLTGQTITTISLSNNLSKQRSLESVIMIRNR